MILSFSTSFKHLLRFWFWSRNPLSGTGKIKTPKWHIQYISFFRGRLNLPWLPEVLVSFAFYARRREPLVARDTNLTSMVENLQNRFYISWRVLNFLCHTTKIALFRNVWQPCVKY
jgi:hypothetical protein